jgi:hypothetical protein
MTNTKQLVFLVAALLLAIFAINNVAALGTIGQVEVNGVDTVVNGIVNIGAFAGDTLPVRAQFVANATVNDVRIKAWISGGREYSAVTERFDVVNGSTYSRELTVQLPSDIDPNENFELKVVVEAKDGSSVQKAVSVVAQRSSYAVDVLDVNMDNKVVAGTSLPIDIVIENAGRHSAKDTFVQASIPSLGIFAKGYFGDLYAVDNTSADQSDAAERMLVLKVPASAPAGVYTVEIKAYNGDSVTTTERKIAIVGAGENTAVVSPVMSKSFAVGETVSYSVTLVNSGDKIQVYELVLDGPSGLNVAADESVVVIPAGSSKTVKLDVTASKAGKYAFSVDVTSAGNVVKTANLTANVEGRAFAGNATVLLTVILAIIFVVLLVVLIVLLTRKPKKTEDFGESYY